MCKVHAVVVAALLCAGAAWAGAPTHTVETLHAALLDSMKQGAALACEARAQRLAPVVAASYDFRTIARQVLRKHWGTLAEAQQQRLVEALQALALANYVGNFNRHGGEAFETLATEDSGSSRLVRTRLTRSHDPPVSLDYLLRESDGAWRIVNVIAEGVSDLAMRSAQYDGLYGARGYDGLLAGIQTQITQARAGCR